MKQSLFLCVLICLAPSVYCAEDEENRPDHLIEIESRLLVLDESILDLFDLNLDEKSFGVIDDLPALNSLIQTAHGGGTCVVAPRTSIIDEQQARIAINHLVMLNSGVRRLQPDAALKLTIRAKIVAKDRLRLAVQATCNDPPFEENAHGEDLLTLGNDTDGVVVTQIWLQTTVNDQDFIAALLPFDAHAWLKRHGSDEREIHDSDKIMLLLIKATITRPEEREEAR